MDCEESELVQQLAGLIENLRKTSRAKQAAQKQARVRGEAYISYYGTGKPIPKRQQGPVCPSTCRWKCTKRITSEDRKAVFKDFWSLADRHAQWDYVASSLLVQKKKTATTKDRVIKSRRANSRCYFFHLERSVEQVCKTMFLNTLGISNCWLHTVCKKLEEKGYVSEDERGQHRRKKKKKADDVERDDGDDDEADG